VVTDAAYMRRALFHAARGQGGTSPNPLVGAVVVSPEGVVVGQGYHRRAGAAHAEVHALDEAGHRARGATLYVTLEPCCHVGRTGPCTRRIIEAGVRRVVAALPDPNPLVDGRGFAALRDHGIEVDVGVEREAALGLNQGFLCGQSRNRPQVILKAATSLDARIAAQPGVRTELTGREALQRTHLLRAAVDAVAVGSSTILIDNPLLTVRECHRAQPLPRIVFDRRLRTPPDARLFSTLGQGPVIIVTNTGTVGAAPERARALERAGALLLATTGTLADALARVRERGVSTLLVEGGAELHGALWDARLVDRVHLFIAPVMLGERGVPLMGGRPVPRSSLDIVRVEPRGDDTWIELDVHGTR
jgi:diaminohydroxyphosphoribosylaminopyrimidine deaminase/5-amino-6-(5-phosphoribosylamino)uracil reductase